LPTAGLLISSVRDKESLTNSGWWTAFFAHAQVIKSRTDNKDSQLEEGGKYIIQGNLLEDGQFGVVTKFGLRVITPDNYEVGQELRIKDGSTLTISSNGDYRWESLEPFTNSRGKRIYLSMEVPPSFTLANYFEVLASEGIGQSFLNSFTVTIPATFIPILIAAFAAFALAWMTFPMKFFILSTIIGLLVVPLQMSLIPVLGLYNDVGNFFGVPAKGYWGIWLAHIGFGLPLAIYLLYNYMRTLPREIIEAASIDGADYFDIFIRIILPLCIPALASFAIFQFLWVWNDLLISLVFLDKTDEQIVLTSRLKELLGSRGGNWEILTASAFVTIIVPLTVFLSLQRYFVRGLLSGSVK